MRNPARAEGVRPSSRANRRIWSAQPRVTRSSGFAIRSPARAPRMRGAERASSDAALAVAHHRLAIAGEGVDIDRGNHARRHLADRPTPDELGGSVEVGRRTRHGAARQRLPVVEPGGARFTTQPFERGGHRSGTAPTHQPAPPARQAPCSSSGACHAAPTGAHHVTEMAKLGRVHTEGRRGLPGAQNPRVGTPGRPFVRSRGAHRWPSSSSGTARWCWQGRMEHHRR
jgi:hypothetical protein